MRALDRIALYITCLATTVVIVTTVPIVQQWLPRSDTLLDRRRELPVVPSIDLSRLTPEIRQAVENAREKGLQHAGAELDKLHARIMGAVENNFLGWYFGYWTQQRLALTYAFDTGKSWLTGGNADKDLQERIAREFGLRVIPEPVFDEELQRIARQSVAVFVTSLQDQLQSIPKQYNIPPAQWDAYLETITTMVSQTEGSRSVPLTLKAFSAGLVVSSAGVVTSLAPLVTAQVARTAIAGGAARTSGALARPIARQAVATMARQVAAREIAGTAGSLSTVAGLAVVGGLIVWEVWDHQRIVAENRPLLRNDIDHFLRLYETGLREPDGMIGSILHGLEMSIVANLTSR